MNRPSILFFGTFDDRRNPRAAILREGLVAHGFDVRSCVVELGISTEVRVLMLRRPWMLPLFVVRLVAAWTRLLVRSRHHRHPDVVVVGYLAHFDIHLARLRYRRSTLVLDHLVSLAGTAADRRVKPSPFTRLLAAVDHAAIRAADIVLVDTEEHAAEIVDPRGEVVVVPVGASEATFRVRRDNVEPTRGLRVIFYGHFIPLQGAPTIGAAIAELCRRGRDDIHVTLVGRGQDLQATKEAANGAHAVFVDRIVSRAELNAIVADHDVSLGIFGTGAKAGKVVPTKAYESAAAGLVVVTGDTLPQRRAFGDAAVYVRPGDAVGLADALERLADDPIARAEMRTRSAGLADREFRPAQIAGPLAARLEGRARRVAKPAPPLALNAWHRYAIVDPVIEKLAPTAMVEVGVGRGAMSARLAGHADRYVAVEPDAESRAAAHDALDGHPGARVVETVDAARVDAPFDLLAAFEVVEHIEDDVAALTDWAGLVRPGGTVVLSVPAHRCRFGAADVAVGHWRRYDRDDVEHLISSSGLHLDSIFATGWPVGYALEAAWNVAATLRTSGSASRSCEERSAGSGRWHQPGRHVGGCWRWISLPGRLAQRVGRERGWGTGWVVVAHR